MKRFERNIRIVFVIVLLASLFSLGLLTYNFKRVNRIMTSEIHELYQHTIKLKIDNESFRIKLHNLEYHPEDTHLKDLRDALDGIDQRLKRLEDLALRIPADQKVRELYSPLAERMETMELLIDKISGSAISKEISELQDTFDGFDKDSRHLIIETDRMVMAYMEGSVAILKRNERRVLVTSQILFLTVLALIVISSRYRISLQKLKSNEEELSVVLDSVRALVLSIDPDFRVTTQNSRVTKRLGDSALGRELFEIFPDLPLTRGEISRCITEGLPVQKSYKRRDAEDKQDELMVYPLSGGSSPGAVIIITDRSEQTRMKELIAQNEKMLSVGGLAAGMAHEINNPLAGMIQTAAVIRSRLTDRELKGNIRAAEDCGLDMDHLAEYLEKRDIIRLFDGMYESGEQASAIVGNMLDFVQRDNTAVSSQDMEKLVERSLKLAATDYDMKSYLYFDKIMIIREFEDDLPLIPCSAGRIQQVILNILRNGAEAMVVPREGPPEGSHFIIRLKRAGSYIRLEIEDNGPGMEEEVRRRIFDPFYTTKGIGQGTGLGLSVSYFIITENHKGSLRVISIPGEKTNFIIELPLAEEENNGDDT